MRSNQIEVNCCKCIRIGGSFLGHSQLPECKQRERLVHLGPTVALEDLVVRITRRNSESVVLN